MVHRYPPSFFPTKFDSSPPPPSCLWCSQCPVFFLNGLDTHFTLRLRILHTPPPHHKTSFFPRAQVGMRLVITFSLKLFFLLSPSSPPQVSASSASPPPHVVGAFPLDAPFTYILIGHFPPPEPPFFFSLQIPSFAQLSSWFLRAPPLGIVCLKRLPSLTQ